MPLRRNAPRTCRPVHRRVGGGSARPWARRWRRPAVAGARRRRVRWATNRSLGSAAAAHVRDRGAAGQGHERDPSVPLAADLRGVAADPEPLAGREHRLGAHAAGAARVPRQRQAVDRVEGGDALARHGARAGLVALEGVVLPAHVAADVDGAAGHGDAVRRVATGVVDPGRVVARAGRLPAGRRVAQRAGARAARERAGGRDHEVAAVRGEVDVAHERVERRRRSCCAPRRSGWSPTARRVAVGAAGVEHRRSARGSGRRRWRSCRPRRAASRRA